MSLLNRLSNILFGVQRTREHDRAEAAEASSADANSLNDVQRSALEQGELFVEQINESLQLANNSTNPETKVGRLEFARQRLADFQDLVTEYPFLRITNLDGVQRSIQALENEFTVAGYYAETDSSLWREKPSAIHESIQFPINGWTFSATLQLRTPLQYLTAHRQFHPMESGPPPSWGMQFGCWVPQTKTFREIGIDLPELELTNRTCASEIGQVPIEGGEFLHFLKAVRTIVEGNVPAEQRLAALRQELSDDRWQVFCARLGGREAIYDRFFPSFIECLPKLNAESVRQIWDKGWTTPAALMAASDKELLDIKGIGPAKLVLIRQACIDAPDKDSERLDLVQV